MGDHPDRSRFVAQASAQLLRGLARLSVAGLETPLAPTSYFMGSEARIVAAISAGYNALVLKEVRRGLDARLKLILDPEAQPPYPPGARSDDHPPTLRFAGMVEQLAEFDSFLDLYRHLPETRSAANLATVVRYAQGLELPSEFVQNAKLYAEALAYTTIQEPGNVRQRVDDRIAVAFPAATRFDPAPLAVSLETIARALRGELPPARDSAAAAATLTDLRERLHFLERSLTSPANGWINGTDLTLLPTMEAALRKLAGLSFGTSEYVAILHQGAEARLKAGRERLQSLVSAGSVPMLHLDHGKAVLAPEVESLRQALDAVFARPVMEAPGFGLAKVLPDGSRPVDWDSQQLAQAQALAENYTQLAAQDLPRLTSPALRELVRTVAL
ncbi:MAG: hypothetical protein K2Q10_12100, partial [Rhodospirillales bacterium]|nr:hypothetical protein [Rhodospirillales bacterium]